MTLALQVRTLVIVNLSVRFVPQENLPIQEPSGKMKVFVKIAQQVGPATPTGGLLVEPTGSVAYVHKENSKTKQDRRRVLTVHQTCTPITLLVPAASHT